VGVRHTLFPRLLTLGAQLHSRVSLAASFPTLRWSAWTLAGRSGSAAEPARFRFPFRELVGRGFSAPKSACLPAGGLETRSGRAWGALTETSVRGRHSAVAESLALHYGSCLLSLKLRSRPRRATLFSAPPALGSCCALAACLSRGSAARRSIRDEPSACASRMRPRNLPAARFSSQTARIGFTTLAHSSNCRPDAGLCSPTPSETPDGRA
jgi:hypothetical protein